MYLPVSSSNAKGLVTTVIVIVNTVIYLYTSLDNYFLSVSSYWLEKLSYSPVMLYSGEWYRLFTSMFTHADIFHIFFNMYFLYFFGREVEKRIGSLKYLLLYVCSGLAAIFFHTAFISITSSIGLVVPAIGASGAISGVLGAYLLSYPRRVLTFCLFIPLPICFPSRAGIFLIFWFALQVVYGYLRFESSIAYFAHAGGFIAGIALLYLLAPRLLEHRRYTIYNGVLFFVKTIRRGLGKGSKIVLSILILSLLTGSFVSLLNASKISGIHEFKIMTMNEISGLLNDTAIYISDHEVIVPMRDDPRVVFNRFLWSGLIRNETNYVCKNCKISLVIKDPVYGHSLNLEIYGFIEYDQYGVLKNFTGVVVTDVLQISRIGFRQEVSIRPGVKYSVLMYSNTYGENIGLVIIQPFALISSLVSLTALYVSLFKDKELVEPEYVYEPVESTYTYFMN